MVAVLGTFVPHLADNSFDHQYRSSGRTLSDPTYCSLSLTIGATDAGRTEALLAMIRLSKNAMINQSLRTSRHSPYSARVVPVSDDLQVRENQGGSCGWATFLAELVRTSI